ncbi:MAG TPA: prenyltransferase/squalene oxidase repeat-containing protein [Candidatus Brocadiia bacterium]|nr:prenyltransferase/squalene oxidase repeat-containing protein [Candidatus Brocadiia bacterium]
MKWLESRAERTFPECGGLPPSCRWGKLASSRNAGKAALLMTVTALMFPTARLFPAAGSLYAADVKGATKPARDASLLNESRHSIDRALNWLDGRQGEDGSWCQHSAITALAVAGYLGSGEEKYGRSNPKVAKALAFVRSKANKDGSIGEGPEMVYTTSICLMALLAAGDPADGGIIRGARQYLLTAQADEGEGLAPDDPSYGGFGYAKAAENAEQRRADLSNTQWALEALKFSEFVESAPDNIRAGEKDEAGSSLHWDKAIAYLSRCQNAETNPDKPAHNDGGFFYRHGESKAGISTEGGLRSYGGMTYAGLKSMVYARLDRDDPRVMAAWKWINERYTLDENPGLGVQGLYYYYHTFAKAHQVYGLETFKTPDGKVHDWRAEFVNKLVSIQKGDGFWVNENGRWWENMPELTTAYCVLALEVANSGW